MSQNDVGAADDLSQMR